MRKTRGAAGAPIADRPGRYIRRLQRIAVALFLGMLRTVVVADNAASRARPRVARGARRRADA